ncbi:acyl-CoA dehydrogenase [Micromonospora sp. NPDC050200]|uniref:acyl-CoA dehydrogenase n=1 Tax=Micromonospora sp. NPDC050200 TaxID=3155664 RepID=UPI0033EEE229
MSLGLSPEHRALRDSVRSFTARHASPAVVRAAVDARAEMLPPFWSVLAEQGLLALHLPEDVGGAGYALLELAVVLEEFGRALVPGPFLPTVVASIVLHAAGHRAELAALAAGTVVGAVALEPGALTATAAAAGGLTLSGTSAPVLGGQLADVFVLPVAHSAKTTWVVLRRAALTVSELASYDLTRRLARIHAEGVHVPADDVLSDLDPRRPLDLAATLFAAEASGVADWATSTAAAHAVVREQFGRPIGQFQGVKHRCARMLVRAEQARACAWDAARAQDAARVDAPVAPETAAEAALAAAVAAATSVEAGFTVAKDCIQTLGGIGFTWEHDAGRYLRRAQALRLLLGPTARWQRRVAELRLSGVRRTLSVDLPEEAHAIRADVRDELEPAKLLAGAERRAYLAARGYTAPHLPVPWGRGADPVSQLVIAEELRTAGLRPADMVVGDWVVPTLVAYGSEEQKQRFLPPTLRGDLVWCQLFSEPGAGSDLAGLATRAERVADGWRLRGQKVWTSLARDAHWGICLARTDPTAPKHRGLSYFLVEMSSPGIDVRPLRELTGESLFNEVFLDDVFVPDAMLVGRPGEGWKIARTTLSNERVSLSFDPARGAGGEHLLELAGPSPEAIDDHRLTVLGQILCDGQSGQLLGLRQALRAMSGQQPGPESSIAKLLGVEHVQQVWETAMDWRGTEALTVEPKQRNVTWRFLNTRALSIAGGTTDVQLNIIGERLLGLPRDPESPVGRRQEEPR